METVEICPSLRRNCGAICLCAVACARGRGEGGGRSLRRSDESFAGGSWLRELPCIPVNAGPAALLYPIEVGGRSGVPEACGAAAYRPVSQACGCAAGSAARSCADGTDCVTTPGRYGLRLRFAEGGDQKRLAFVNKIRVAKLRIGLGDAGPGSAVTQLRLSDGPERVAVTDGVLHGSSRRSDGRWHNNLRTYRKKVGIAKTGIQSEQFLPPASIAESRSSKLPKRVAGLDSDDHVFPRR